MGRLAGPSSDDENDEDDGVSLLSLPWPLSLSLLGSGSLSAFGSKSSILLSGAGASTGSVGTSTILDFTTVTIEQQERIYHIL